MVERNRSYQGMAAQTSSNEIDTADAFEKEVLDHYEINREKHNDERDNIQKKTFTKWVNKHLSKTNLKVDDLFIDLRDGYALIALLEALTGERIKKENGYTRFHRIQNVEYCLDFLRKKNIKLVNIRSEDIVEGNGKLTLGLIWTIILNFQVSVIRQRLLLESQHERIGSGTTHSAAQVSEALHGSDATSARDALLQWARKVTSGYPRVNVNNFSSSWRDGLAFNAILHRYRPNIIDWNKISSDSVSNRERLDNAFAAAEKEFGVSRLLDAEDVDTNNPDEKSIITYVSSLYNALPHLPEVNRGNMNDLISRLERGIGITNEKLDLILKRIEDVEARVDTSPPAAVERTVTEIVDDLNLLENPIAGFFDDVEELKNNNHPEANDFYRRVYGLHQRRTAYLDRLTNQILVRLGVRTESLQKENQARLDGIRQASFSRVEECIEWVRVRMEKLTAMEFLEDLETLEQMFEQHKLDNRDIQDFRQNVDECIARQAEVSAEDTYEYCELLRVLESEYQQLRDLSAGRMLDLDSLIAFVRAAQLELIWVSEREEIEVTRNWSDINQLDLPMLTNYYKQLLHEMELREKQYNDVHNQGAALLNQGHPAIHVIETYLRTMQNQWDWLLALSKCLEEHLRDALNLKSFMEEAADAEAWIQEQSIRLENSYNSTDVSLTDGEKFLRELDEMKEILNKYHGVLMALTERCATISPLWQRGERIPHPMNVTALCDYNDKNITIRAGDDVVLLDNSDLIKWTVRDLSGVEGQVPSVVFRIPPPDAKLTAFLNRLLQQFEKLMKLWEKKHRTVRINMVLNTMRTIQDWDLDTFNSLDPENRDRVMKALNDDVNKLLSELDPNDPLALRLREELRKTNEHFWNLLNASQKPPEPDWASQYDQKMGELLRKLEEAWRMLNDNVGKPVSRSAEDLERVIHEHKRFEDALQGLDGDVANVKELFRQLPNPTPTQRANNDRLSSLWDDLWDLSRMYVERIKVLESVLNGMVEVADIVKQHEITLNSFDDLPAALDKLRGHHSQLLEINMVLKQQQTVIDQLNKNVALLRQHVARTRVNEGHHPDVDAIEDEVQKLNVRWENVNSQVADRLVAAERALQVQMVYRSEYETEMAWLDTVEETINSLRNPEDLRPEQYQQQLDMLVAEYSHLQEHTQAIENVNKEGGKFIRDAKNYDAKMGQYSDAIVGIHGPDVRSQFRRTKPQPKNGAQIVTEELELLNRRFAQLSSLILERRNTMQVLIQNWKRQKQENATRIVSYRETEISDMLSDLSNYRKEIFTSHLVIDPNPQSIQNASKNVEKMKDSLNSWRDRVKERIDAIDELCTNEADSLTPEQFATLREKRKQLGDEYETVLRTVEAVHARLNILASLLIEFSSLTSSMQSWMTDRTRLASDIRHKSADPNKIDMARMEARTLLDEVEHEELRLRDIGNSVNKIEREIEQMRREMRSDEEMPTGIAIDEVRGTKQRVEDDYLTLVQQCKDLLEFQSKVYQINDEHAEKARNADEWLIMLQRDVDEIERSNIDDEEKLARIEELNRMAAGGSSQLEEAEMASQRLLSALEGTEAEEDVKRRHEESHNRRRDKHQKVLDRLRTGMSEAAKRKALADGARQAAVDMIEWSREAVRKTSTPLELKRMDDKALNDENREAMALMGELESKMAVVKDLERKAFESGNDDLRNLVEECGENLKKSAQMLRDGCRDRTDELEKRAERDRKMKQGLEQLLRDGDSIVGAIQTIGRDDGGMDSPSDVKKIAAKLNEAKGLVKMVEDRRKEYEKECDDFDANEMCRKEIEAQLRKIEDEWKRMSDRLDEKERRIDSSAQEMGKFDDAHRSLLNWLEETEEMVENQRPPSADPKVAKAQLHAYDVLMKHVEDKQSSVDAFAAMVDKIVQEGGGSDDLMNKKDAIRKRYEDLLNGAHERQQRLLDAVDLAERLKEVAIPLEQWLNDAEKRLQGMSKVPITVEKAKQMIEKHGQLQDELDSKVDDIRAVLEIAPLLKSIVANEDGMEVDAVCNKIEARCHGIDSGLNTMKPLLDDFVQQIEDFTLDAEDMQKWIEETKNNLLEFEELPIAPDDLIEQSNLLADIAASIAEKDEAMTSILEVGRQLAVQGDPEEALRVQQQIEDLKFCYSDLMKSADDKIALLGKAISLSERFHEVFDGIMEWLDTVESDLQIIDEEEPETQAEFIFTLEEDIAKWRPEVEDLTVVSKQLQELCSPEKAEELHQNTMEMNKIVNGVAEQVARRAERIDIREKQSRAVLNDLCYLVEWFADANERMMRAGPPSVDPEYLKTQLKHQRLMNEDVDGNKAQLRNAVAEAKKVARQLGVEEANEELVEKCEQGKQLMDDVSAMCAERTELLERALVLAEQLATQFNDLNDWLDNMNGEIQAAAPVTTATPANELRALSDHNNELVHVVNVYMPILARFRGDVESLQKICGEHEAQLLGEIADEVISGYDDVRDAVRSRGQAIDKTMNATIGFGERIETLMSSLNGAAQRLDGNKGISADPSVLEGCIAENATILESLRDKQNAYDALKVSANELIDNSSPDDAAVGDVENKLNVLALMWKEIEEAAIQRGDELGAVLEKARFFWNEIDSCQKIVDELSSRLDMVEPAIGQPQQLTAQQETLNGVGADLEKTRPRIEALSVAGHELANFVDSNDEKGVIETQVANVNDGFATITGLFADKKRDLVAAMEDAMAFHTDIASIVEWLDTADARVASMVPVESATKIAQINGLLDELREFKSEVDERGVEKERVLAVAHQLAADAPPHLAHAVKQPIAELNGRWTKLNATLAEREHKLESSLLQMGKLSEAIEQINTWLDKTQSTLDEIPPNVNSLKNIELAKCRLVVIGNDVQAHEHSISTVNETANRYGTDAETMKKLEDMNRKWESVQKTLSSLKSIIDDAKQEADNVGRHVDKWQTWLDEVEEQLMNAKPTGGLPDTAEQQLNEFRVLKADIEQNSIPVNAHLDEVQQMIASKDTNGDEWLAKAHSGMKAKWSKIGELYVDREKKFQLAYEHAVALENDLNDMEQWVIEGERRIANLSPISRLPEMVGKQLREEENWMEEVVRRKTEMTQHQTAGIRVQYYCSKKDSIPIKNRIVSLKLRCEKIYGRSAERIKQLNAIKDDVGAWQDGVHEIDAFVDDIMGRVCGEGEPTNSLDKLRERLEVVQEAATDVGVKQMLFDLTRRRGSAIAEQSPRSEYKTIMGVNDKMAKRWNEMMKRVRDRQRECEQAVLEGGAFEEAMNELESWIDGELERRADEDTVNVFGDVDTVGALIAEENRRAAEKKTKENSVKTVLKKADSLLASGANESDSIKDARDRLVDKWGKIEELSKRRSDSIKEAEEAAKVFDAKTHALLDWLAAEEHKMSEPVTSVKKALANVEEVKKDMEDAKEKYDECFDMGAGILEKCQPGAEPTLRNWLRVVETRWKEVGGKVEEREFTLLEEEQKEKERDDLVAALAAFTAEKRVELNRMMDRPLATELDAMSVQLKEMSDLDFELREKQPEIDAVCKAASGKKAPRHAASEMLSTEWKKIWLDAMGLQSALDAQKDMLEEMKRLETWKWEDWKERYVEWNDHAKGRVSDLFRRIDKQHTGNVPRQVFIDGIIGSKFPTSRLEMEKVADVFDKGDGMINSKEFINALRFDSAHRNAKPMTDTEKITVEIERQKKTCSCCQPYQIEKVSENHYRFGDTHIKRMVRILRSTVMVRVGGGWESLDEFLHKHDPCRAKGRLNINMFPEAKPTHALDSMRAFTKNRHARVPQEEPTMGTQGPIMKIREKTERSVPMFGGPGGTAGYTPTRIPRAPSDLSVGSLSRTQSRSNSKSSLFDGAPTRPDSRASSEAGTSSRIPSIRGKKGVRYDGAKM